MTLQFKVLEVESPKVGGPIGSASGVGLLAMSKHSR
jgi:hypothetical protein